MNQVKLSAPDGRAAAGLQCNSISDKSRRHAVRREASGFSLGDFSLIEVLLRARRGSRGCRSAARFSLVRSHPKITNPVPAAEPSIGQSMPSLLKPTIDARINNPPMIWRHNVFRSFTKGQSTTGKNSPISLSRAYRGRLSLGNGWGVTLRSFLVCLRALVT